jgi:predicted nucleic acid-binding Zn ribbon protein
MIEDMIRTTTLLLILFLLFLVVATSVVLEDVYKVGLHTLAKYYLAQIGITVSIPPNPFNILAQQLKEKESTLSAKEQEIQQKETLLKEQEREKKDKIILYFSLVGVVLLILVLVNFYLDYRRRRTSQISS